MYSPATHTVPGSLGSIAAPEYSPTRAEMVWAATPIWMSVEGWSVFSGSVASRLVTRASGKVVFEEAVKTTNRLLLASGTAAG
jgi:hypothetical protein